MKVVVDTNVLVSGIFWGGRPGEVLNHWRSGKADLLATIDTLEEYLRVIARLGKHEPELVEEWTAYLWKHLMLVEKTVALHECRDPHDDMFLECAVSGGADCIVTGDDDLLVMGSVRGVRVVSVNGFLSLPR